ncbi:MAG: hypothetical protein Kow0025_09910 [Thermodesulfovibrionales bacterium]
MLKSLFLTAAVAAALAAPAAALAQTGYDKAMESYVRGDFASAVDALKEYVSESPEARAFYVLGYASYAMEKNEEAASYFRQAYLIDPSFDPGSIGFQMRR